MTNWFNLTDKYIYIFTITAHFIPNVNFVLTKKEVELNFMCCKWLDIYVWSAFSKSVETFPVVYDAFALNPVRCKMLQYNNNGGDTHEQCTGSLRSESSSLGSSRRCSLIHTRLVCGGSRSIIFMKTIIKDFRGIYNLHTTNESSVHWSTNYRNTSPVCWPLCRTPHQRQRE